MNLLQKYFQVKQPRRSYLQVIQISRLSDYCSKLKLDLGSSNARLMGAEDDEDSAVERGLTICRKVLIALLVFLALLYYVTYEYDEVYYENQNGQVRKKGQTSEILSFQASENLFKWFSSADTQASRPAMVAPDPFKLPPPDPTEEADHHLPLGTWFSTSLRKIQFGPIIVQ